MNLWTCSWRRALAIQGEISIPWFCCLIFFFFFASIISFCILYFHLWACFPPYISSVTGQKLQELPACLIDLRRVRVRVLQWGKGKRWKKIGRKLTQQGYKVRKAAPVCIVGYHTCWNSPGWDVPLLQQRFVWFGTWDIQNRNQMWGRKQPQLWELQKCLIRDEPVHL